MAGAAERALAAAAACGDPRAVHEAAPLLATALHRGVTPLEEVVKRVTEVRESHATDRLTGAILQLTESLSLAQLGRTTDAREIIEAARRTFRDLGQRRWLAATDEVGAEIERLDGHLTRAIALHRDVHAFFVEQGDALNALPAAAALAERLLEADREEAERLVAQLEGEVLGEDLETSATWMSVGAVVAAGQAHRERADAESRLALEIVDATDFVLLQADVRAILMGAAPDPESAERLRTEALQRYDAKGALALAAELRREAS
jgi:hypothetical protein